MATADIMQLLHRAKQTAHAAFMDAVDHTISPSQYAVLKAIGAIASPSQTTLVTATHIDRSTMADIIRRLQKMGLVRRKRSKQDARAYEVTLTERGEDALRRADDAAMQANKMLLAKLSKPQIGVSTLVELAA